MKFHLIYHGGLPASGNKSKPKETLAIREHFNPQLELMWNVNPSLQELKYSAFVPHQDSRIATTFDSPFRTAKENYERTNPRLIDQLVNLCEPIQVGAYKYIPLVRKSLYLNCSLSILFLRKDEPGALITQSGDIDNRVKTLLDGLRVPAKSVQDKFKPKNETTYCLLESDTLVSGLEIETDRLLFPKTDEENEVHLIIEVKVHVLRAGSWNLCLL